MPDPNSAEFVQQMIQWIMDNGKAIGAGSLVLVLAILMISVIDRRRDTDQEQRDDGDDSNALGDR